MKKEYFTPDLELVKFDFPTELMASGEPPENPDVEGGDIGDVG